jgi:hypothetical protein
MRFSPEYRSASGKTSMFNLPLLAALLLAAGRTEAAQIGAPAAGAVFKAGSDITVMIEDFVRPCPVPRPILR